jgi:general secretion pathway protein G
MRFAYWQLGVVALLAFGSGPGCPGQALNTRDATRLARSLLDDTAKALDTYAFDIGHYPIDEEGGLLALVNKPGYASEILNANWHQYMKKLPVDPWGNELKYAVNAGAADSQPFKLWSVGPDGQDGTDDDIIYGVEPAGAGGGSR